MSTNYIQIILDYPECREYWQKSVAYVEATDCEFSYLWDKKDRYGFSSWQDRTKGFFFQVGEINNRPIMVSFRFVLIEGLLVCFYEPTSQLVDWVIVGSCISRLQENGFANPIKTNAMNFNHVRDHIRELQKRK